MVSKLVQVIMALVLILIFSVFIGVSQAQMRVGFYSETCPDVESTVQATVQDAALSNPNIPAVLLRLHFHDCFVQVLYLSLSLSLSLTLSQPSNQAFY